MDRCLASRRIWDSLLEFLNRVLAYVKNSLKCALYQVIEDAFIKLPFLTTALPELLIVVIKASPVLAKFGETVLVDIFDSV